MKKIALGILRIVFPMPKMEMRRECFVPIQWLSPAFDIRRDVDYLCYQLYLIILFLGFGVTVLMFVDIGQGWNSLVNYDILIGKKFTFISCFSKIMGPTTLALSFIFYFRCRLEINIRETKITQVADLRYFKGKTKAAWVQLSFFQILFSVIIILFSHIITILLLKYFHIENNTFFVGLALILPMLMIPYGALLCVRTSLLVEKIFSNFSKVQADFEIQKNKHLGVNS